MNIPSDTAPSEALAEGDVILVRIVQIDVAQERLSLSTRRVTASEEISWMQSRQEAEAEFNAETVTEDVEAETEAVIE